MQGSGTGGESLCMADMKNRSAGGGQTRWFSHIIPPGSLLFALSLEPVVRESAVA